MTAMREVSVGANPIERTRQAWLDAVFAYGDHVERCERCAAGLRRCAEGQQLAREDGRLWSVYQEARLGVGVV